MTTPQLQREAEDRAGGHRALFLETRTRRKMARTAIYRALYGDQNYTLRKGSKRPNQPWSDPTRTRPEGWTPSHALATIEHYWLDAQFDDFRKHIINDDLGLTGADALK